MSSQFSASQQDEFRRLFAVRRRRQFLLAIPLLPVIIAVIVAREGDSVLFGLPSDVWGPVFFVFVIGALAFSLWNWRCPACSKYLGKSVSPRYCPRCGVAFHSDL